MSGNTANLDGGGIEARNFAAIFNSTVVDNDADHDRDENGGIGGGINTSPGTPVALVNSRSHATPSSTRRSTTTATVAWKPFGRNLFGVSAGCVILGQTRVGAPSSPAAELGPLQDIGGPTATHALLAGSVAINGTFAATPCQDADGLLLPSDQRGLPRIAGVRCDVGAYEFGLGQSNVRAFANGFE